jgi:ABC-type lipoprotein export system ATPase subunit
MTNSSIRPFTRGSEWRKWDLHLHCPGTKLNDGFKITAGDPWGIYCAKLHESDVQAFGITDYFSIDGYRVCVKEYRQRYPDCHKILLPNVELRTNDVVNKAQEEVNVHLLFNPFLADHEIKIAKFLRCLKTNRTLSEGYVTTADELNSTANFESATTTRMALCDALIDTYGTAADLSDYVLVLTAANNDGIRTERGKMRKALITDELDKISHGFMGHSGNVAHFLDTHRLEDKAQWVEPKPVFSGSDAHSFDDLDRFLGKYVPSDPAGRREPTWIKADLTFEGLKQTLFEPGERVFIGEEPEIEARVRGNATRYLRELTVTHVDGYANSAGRWFQDERIPLNKELVAIIGNKGSGKSALSDVIGLLGNTHNQRARGAGGRVTEELFSFLTREKFLKANHAVNFLGELHWYAGSSDRRKLDESVNPDLPEKVEYLPQKYLERICSNIADDEFRTTLNAVIFGYVREEERHRLTTFDELIAYLSSQGDETIRSIQQELHTANEAVANMEQKLTLEYRREIEQRIRDKDEELASHTAQPPPEKVKPDESAATQTDETAQVAQLEAEVATLAEQIRTLTFERTQTVDRAEDVRQARVAIDRQVKALQAMNTAHGPALERAGIAFNDVVKVSVDWAPLDAAALKFDRRLLELAALLADEREIAAEVSEESRQTLKDSSFIQRRLALTLRKETLTEKLGQPQREYQAYLDARRKWEDRGNGILGDDDAPAFDSLRGLRAEFVRVDGEYREALIVLKAARDQVARRIFQEKRGLIRFYDSIKAAIDREIGLHRTELGDYAISIDAGLRFETAFNEEFFRHIAQNAKGTFYGKDDGKAALNRIVSQIVSWEDEMQVFTFLGQLLEALARDLRPDIRESDRTRSTKNQLREGKTVVQLYDYIFGFDYLKPKYDLKVDQKDLSELSPGERGGLLLVFYLMLDRREIPLVIDQPEDNLDNKSVYEILVRFIKKAKKRRQIIIVTHNPNLAVVADAEQIIRVSIDKKNENDFSFFAGAIENPQINAVVVDILEGTRPAFDNRRLKYRRPS